MKVSKKDAIKQLNTAKQLLNKYIDTHQTGKQVFMEKHIIQLESIIKRRYK